MHAAAYAFVPIHTAYFKCYACEHRELRMRQMFTLHRKIISSLTIKSKFAAVATVVCHSSIIAGCQVESIIIDQPSDNQAKKALMHHVMRHDSWEIPFYMGNIEWTRLWNLFPDNTSMPWSRSELVTKNWFVFSCSTHRMNGVPFSCLFSIGDNKVFKSELRKCSSKAVRIEDQKCTYIYLRPEE